nr:XF1762 family protein [Pseudomonas aeruginosa]
MNTPSTSPRLHLLPVSLRTANAFVLSHHRHHRPVQGAKFALAVTLSDSDLIHGVAIVGRPVARHLDAGSHAAVHRRHTQRLQQALRRGLAGGKGAGLHTPAHLHHARRRWRQPARRRLAADRRARWRRLEPSRPSARRYPEHLRGAKCL